MKKLLVGFVVALVVVLMVGTTVLAGTGLPLGKFWQAGIKIPVPPVVKVTSAPMPPEIIPGQRVELVRFAVGNGTEEHPRVLLTDILFSFFYEDGTDYIDKFTLFIGDENQSDIPITTVTEAFASDPALPKKVNFLVTDGILITGPVTLSIRADVAGTGTIRYFLYMKVLDPNGNPLKTEGLPIPGTISVVDAKVFAALSTDTPLGKISTGEQKPVMKFKLAATGPAKMESLTLSFATADAPVIIVDLVRLWDQEKLIGEAVAYKGKATFNWPPDNRLVLLGGSNKTITVTADLVGSGKLQAILESISAISDVTATIASVSGLPVFGGTLLVSEPITFEVPREYPIQEAFRQAKPGDTISLAPGRYGTRTEIDGFPILPGGVTIQGEDEGKTFVFGRLISDGDATHTTGDITIKNVTLVGPPAAENVVQAGQRLTLENVTILANGSVGVVAGWNGVILDVRDSTFVSLNNGASIGIEVAGELNGPDSVVAGNTFVSFGNGLSVPVRDFEEFSQKVIAANFFYGVETPVALNAFG